MSEALHIDVYGFLNPYEARLLHDLAAAVPTGGTIVELGSFRGKSTVALAWGAKLSGATVWAIDPHESYHQGEVNFGPEDNSAFLQNIVRMEVHDVVRVINLSSSEVAAIWNQPIDLLFLDANHDYEQVKLDFLNWAHHVRGAVAMHDTGGLWPGVTRFVDELLAAGHWEKIEMADATSVFRRVRHE